MSGVGGVIGSGRHPVRICDCAVRGWKMVFSLQAIVIAVTVSGRSGFSSTALLRVAPRRSIRSRHCGMNEPIGSVQPVVLLEEPVEIVSARGAGRFPCWIGSMRGSMRVNAWC